MNQKIELPYHITLLLAGILFVSARNADYNRQLLNITKYNRWHQPKVECICSCAKPPIKSIPVKPEPQLK